MGKMPGDGRLPGAGIGGWRSRLPEYCQVMVLAFKITYRYYRYYFADRSFSPGPLYSCRC
jgi:hypothetical protein